MTLDTSKMEEARSPCEDETEMNSDGSSVESERKSDGCSSSLNLSARDNANINVFCRFRPYQRPKTGYEDEYELHFRKNGKEVGLRFSTSIGHPINGEAYRFSFDSCFKSKATQENVYNACAKPLVQELLQGYNCTLFAYGQTGSGKTYTMMGDLNDKEKKGILPRLAEDLFLEVGKSRQGRRYTVKLSFIEIYMERIRDLLADDNCSDQPYSLKLRNDEDSGVYVDGVIEEEVGNAKALYRLLAKGNTNRAVGSTKMNAQSSRSHSVCMLTLCQRTDGEVMKVGKLFLVDLAGSEMVKKTGATLSTLNEAKQINKSLSSLGNVIKALKEKSSFVPYRDSKLTLLLKNSLGGDSKTSLIVTCAGGTKETLSTLRFGSRAKQIQNKPTVQKRFCDNSDCKKLRERLLVLEEENLELGVVDVLSTLPTAEPKCQHVVEEEYGQELKKSLAENELLSAQVEEKEIELEALKAMLKRANVSKAQHIEIHQRDLNECLTQNDKLKTKLAVALSEIEELKGSASQRQSQAEFNAERLAEASKVADMEEEIMNLTQRYIHAKVELDELRETRPMADAEIVHIKSRNHILELELKGAKEKMEASVQREATLGIRLLNRESHIELLEAAIHEFQDVFKHRTNESEQQIRWLEAITRHAEKVLTAPVEEEKSQVSLVRQKLLRRSESLVRLFLNRS